MLRTLLLRLALPAALAGAGAGAATASPAPEPLVEMSVVDRDRDQWLAPTWFRGQNWIAGTPGHRYGVRLTNLTGRRVLAVLSVDGVNAISGETARPSQTGYVLEPWQTAQIDGWRKSLDHVAQFVFTDLPDSYAARTGRPDNVGVIGVAVFEEAVPWRDEYPVGIAGKAAPSAPAAAESRAADSAARQSIGTGHGQREWSQASRTDFIRATRTPAQVTQLRYDDRATLVSIGVLPRYERRYVHGPRAFPEGFVADPPRD